MSEAIYGGHFEYDGQHVMVNYGLMGNELMSTCFIDLELFDVIYGLFMIYLVYLAQHQWDYQYLNQLYQHLM